MKAETETNAVETEAAGTEAPEPTRTGRLSRLRRAGRRTAGRLAGSRRAQAALAGIVIVLAGGAVGGYYWQSAGQLPSGVALRADGQDVTVSQLQSEASDLKAMYGVEQPSGAAKVDQFWRSMAQAEALRIVLGRVAQAKNIVISGKSAQDVISRFVTTEYGNSSDAQSQFLAALGNAGASEQEVESEIKLMLAENQLYSQVTSGVTVTDAQVRQAFTRQHAQLGTPERRDISNIVVATKAQAATLVSELNHGANFASLAKQVSLDDSSRGSGGNLGTLSESQLDSGYGKAAFAARANQVFGPVQTSSGWNVGEVTKILVPVPATYSAVSGTLKQTLASQKATSLWVKWLARQLRSAHVQYAAKYQPAHPDAIPSSPGLSVPATGASAQPSAQPSS